MGSPSKTLIEATTDKIAAFLKAEYAVRATRGLTATNISLFDYIDASGDPDVETAMGASSLAIDRAALTAASAEALQKVFQDTQYRNWLTALLNLVNSPAGGSNLTLEAYLAGKSAVVHPMWAEFVRSVFGESAFTNSTPDVTTVFAPNYVSQAPERVYTGADAATVDDTTDTTDVGTADVALFATNGHALYIGSRTPFAQVVVALSTLANTSIDPLIEYWNGSAWTAVTGLTDSSVGFTKNDRIKWTLPTDWQPSYLDKGGTALADKSRLYYLRIARTQATVGTPPVGTCIRIIPSAVFMAAPNNTKHLGVDQPPLAICRITGTNAISVEAVVDVDITRFVEPAIYLRALTPIGSNLTPTVSYVDQDGNNATQAQSAWTAPAALDEVAVVLAGGDTGVRSMRTTGWAVSTAATEGCFAVIIKERGRRPSSAEED